MVVKYKIQLCFLVIMLMVNSTVYMQRTSCEPQQCVEELRLTAKALVRENPASEEAVRLYTEAISIAEANPDVFFTDQITELYFLRGRVHYFQGETGWDAALEDFNRVLELEVTYTEALVARADLFFEMGIYRNASDGYWIAWNVFDSETINKILLDRGNYFDSHQYETIHTTPEYPDFMSREVSIDLLAFIRFERLMENAQTLLNEPEQSLWNYSRAIEVVLDHPNLFTPAQLAELYLKRGEIYGRYEWELESSVTDELIEYNNAIEADPAYLDAYVARAELFDGMGFEENAIPDYEMVLQLTKETTLIQRTQQALNEIAAIPHISDQPKNKIPVYFGGGIPSGITIPMAEILRKANAQVYMVEAPELSAVSIFFYPDNYVGYYWVEIESSATLQLSQSSLLKSHFSEFVDAYSVVWESLPFYFAGVAFYAMGECDQALTNFDRVNAIYDELGYTKDLAYSYGSIEFFLGVCALQEQRYEEAAAYFEQMAFSDPGGDDPLIPTVGAINLAWTYLQLDRTNDAFEVLDQYVNYYTSRPRVSNVGDFTSGADAFSVRAQFYALNFDFDAAIADMDAAIGLDPENSELYVIRGQIRMLLYEWDAVMDDYNTALELNPGYADAYYYRGVLNYTVAGVGNSDVIALKRDAIADFQHYLDLAPDGLHAEDATDYIEQIEGELEALER